MTGLLSEAVAPKALLLPFFCYKVALSGFSTPETSTFLMSICPYFTATKGSPFFNPTLPKPVSAERKLSKSPIRESM